MYGNSGKHVLEADEETGRFDDAPLQAFVEDERQRREVIDVSEHFFVHEKRPTWALLVSYREFSADGRGRREPRKDWRAELEEMDRKVYDELRTWRNRTAKREGMPPYVIFNNRQVASIVTERPATLKDLRAIEGLGEAKVDRCRPSGR